MNFCRTQQSITRKYNASNPFENNQIPRFGPFMNESRQDYQKVQRFIVENRGSLMNRQQRRNIPIYVKDRNIVTDNANKTIYETMRASQREDSPQKPGFFNKAKSLVKRIITSITGQQEEEQDSYGPVNVTRVTSQTIDTKDQQFERIPIPQNARLPFTNGSNNQQEAQREREDNQTQIQPQRRMTLFNRPQRMEIDSQNQQIKQNLGKRVNYEDQQESQFNDERAQENKRQKTMLSVDQEKLLQMLKQSQQQIQDEKFGEIKQMFTQMNQKIEEQTKTINNLEHKLGHQFKNQVKEKIVSVWNKGTERFYQEAKSIISNNNSYMGEGSVISGMSRSRSGSRDIMLNRQLTTNFNKKDMSRTHSEFGGDLDYQLLVNNSEPPKSALLKKHDDLKDNQKNAIQPMKSSIFNNNDRQGAISPMQLINNQSQPNIFNTNANKNTQDTKVQQLDNVLLTNQSPAFGMSSNNHNSQQSKEKEPIFVSKPPNLEDDESLKKPVAMKPAFQAPSVVSVQSDKKDEAKSEQKQSLFGNAKETVPSQGLFGQNQSQTNASSLFGQNKQDETSKKTTSLFETKANNIGSATDDQKDQVKPIPSSIFSSVSDKKDEEPGQKPSLFGNNQSTNLFNQPKPQDTKTDDKPKPSLFGGPSLISSEKQPTLNPFLNAFVPDQSKKAEEKASESIETQKKQDEPPKASLFSNPLLQQSTISNNPFLNPKSAPNVFAQKPSQDQAVTSAQPSVDSKTTQDTKPSGLFGSLGAQPFASTEKKQETSLFGTNNQQIPDAKLQPQQNTGLFGNAASSASSLFTSQTSELPKASLFGQQTPAQSIFSSGQPSQQQQSLFNTNQSSSSLFSQPQNAPSNPFANTASSNPFAGATNTQPQSIFGAQNTQPAQQTSLFGGQNLQQQQQNPFANMSNPFTQSAQPSVFSGQNQPPVSLFGSTGQQPTSLFQSNQSSQAGPKFGDVTHLFGTPSRNKENDDDDGLFTMGSAGKNASGKKRK